jgi:hypothetical protein
LLPRYVIHFDRSVSGHMHGGLASRSLFNNSSGYSAGMASLLNGFNAPPQGP